MFTRAFLVVAAVALCCAHAEMYTYIPAVLYGSEVKSESVIMTPLKAASNEPRKLAAELKGAALDEKTPAVFILDSRGLNAKILSQMSQTFAATMPAVSAEAAYTNGVEISAFDRTFGCDGRDGFDDLAAFLDSADSEGKTVAICVQGESAIMRAYSVVEINRPDAAVIVTGPNSIQKEVKTDDDDKTTYWPAGVAETIVAVIAVSIPLILAFHLLFSIRPVEDVEYPRHKVSSN